MNIGEVLAAIFARVPDAYFGDTLLRHLTETRGRGRYEEVPFREGNPLQFLSVESGERRAHFVGVAHGRRKITFGDKHDNRE